MKLVVAILSSFLALPACQRSSPGDGAELVWPMPGADPTPAVGAGVGRGESSATLIWRRLSGYGGSFLGHWRHALEAGDEPAPGDVLDAFNELALAVTGPSGFWRKTVPDKWLGCESSPDSKPCQRLGELRKELAQWDDIQKQILDVPPERAGSFLTRNEARLIGYLDTYVPKEPSAPAMKDTPFYRKHLAEVFDTWSGSPPSGGDL